MYDEENAKTPEGKIKAMRKGTSEYGPIKENELPFRELLWMDNYRCSKIGLDGTIYFDLTEEHRKSLDNMYSENNVSTVDGKINLLYKNLAPVRLSARGRSDELDALEHLYCYQTS